MDYVQEFQSLVKYIEESELNVDATGLVVNSNKVLLAKAPDGMKMDVRPIEDGVEATIEVFEGVTIDRPVHLCFGMLPQEGRQVIKSKYVIHRKARVEFISHCIFPNAVKVDHIMDSEVIIKEGGSMTYHEEHIHGNSGGIKVLPRAYIQVESHGRYITSYTQKKGRVGKLDINYTVDVSSHGLADLNLKVYGIEDDEIVSHETVRLNGEGARGMIKSRVVLRNRATSEVWNITEGNAPGSRGHVDCTEIILDEAKAKAIPLVYATHPEAKVTHEAAIGSVDSKQLQTLMARGLSEDEAIELIVQGLLE